MSPRRKNIAIEEIDLTGLDELTQILTQTHGALHLKPLSVADAEYLDGLLKKKLPARDFTVQFVHHQFIEPVLSLDIFKSWPDELLLQLAKSWANNESGLTKIEDADFSFDIFQQLLADYIEEEHRKIRELMGGFSDYLSSINVAIAKVAPPKWVMDNLIQMGALNVKLAGLQVLPKMSFLDTNLKLMYENMGKLVSAPLLAQFTQLSQIKLPEPFLSDAMLVSGLNSPLMHTPAYIMPRIEPIHKREELPIRAEEAIQRRLVDAYDILSRLELSLRSVIEIKLRELYGVHWWKRGVPEIVRNECEERKRREEKSFETGHHPIHYTYLGHCKDIVVRGDNWKASFSAVFGKKTEFEVFIDWVQKVRLHIGHPRPISDDDYLFFTASARWLQIAIDRAISHGPS